MHVQHVGVWRIIVAKVGIIWCVYYSCIIIHLPYFASATDFASHAHMIVFYWTMVDRERHSLVCANWTEWHMGE